MPTKEAEKKRQVLAMNLGDGEEETDRLGEIVNFLHALHEVFEKEGRKPIRITVEVIG